jgi:hypothetical protein
MTAIVYFGPIRWRVGARWYCDRTKGKASSVDRGGPKFTCVVVGPGTKLGHKLCRVEYDNPNNTTLQNFESEYSHKHIKHYAEFVGTRPLTTSTIGETTNEKTEI